MGIGGAIVGRLHGVRPLAAAAGTDVTGRSRDHVIHRHPTVGGLPLISIAGGKWTTFRAIAADAADAVLAATGRSRVISTVRRPIGGGRDFPDEPKARQALASRLAQDFGLGGLIAKRLIAAYGARAPRVAAYLAAPGGRRAIANGALTVGEVRFFAREEMAVGANDVAHRRTRLFLEGRATQTSLAEVEAVLDDVRTGVDGGLEDAPV